jgi:phenylpropionate dioxygenase-like ring-hydroxylating dioxygenase large terminal subunit
LNLSTTPLQQWNGLLFENNGIDIAALMKNLSVTKDLNFDGYMLDHVEVHECDYNWKTFIEVYLEDYHVEPFHPGLSNFVDCGGLHWEMGDWYSVQTVPVNRGLKRAGSTTYGKWQEQVLKYSNGEVPKYGAIWLVYYPNIMIEWYPQVLIVSTVVPRGAQACTNIVEFYFPEEIALFEREYVEAERQAYLETAVEDEVICNRMTEGRRALLNQGISEVGPYQSPTEDGMQHFHEFLHRELDSQLP